RRCLAKDPEERWQSMRDVTSELHWIADQPPSSSVASSHAPRASVAWRVATGVALVVAIAAMAAAAQMLRGREAQADRQPIRFEVATTPTDDPSVSLSADGKALAF